MTRNEPLPASVAHSNVLQDPSSPRNKVITELKAYSITITKNYSEIKLSQAVFV